MSSALDRLAALAAGTAPVAALRRRSRFERPVQYAEEPVVVDDEQPVTVPAEPPVADSAAGSVEESVAQVVPAPVRAVKPASAAPGHARAVEEEPESAHEADVTRPRRTRAATASGSPPAAVGPQSPPPPAPVSEPAAVRTAATSGRDPAPVSPPADVEPPPPDVLLEHHIVPVLVREQVVQRTAVPGPSPRTDVEVVEILGEPRVERVRGEPPQVHVHIREVRVSPPAPPVPAEPVPRAAPPDLDAYLATRREARP